MQCSLKVTDHIVIREQLRSRVGGDVGESHVDEAPPLEVHRIAGGLVLDIR